MLFRGELSKSPWDYHSSFRGDLEWWGMCKGGAQVMSHARRTCGGHGRDGVNIT